MKLNFFVNADEIAQEFHNFKEEVKAAIEQGVKNLAAQTHAKVAELASAKLTQTRKIYMDNLDFEEIAPGVWVVSLDQPALWIEEGRKSGPMHDDLLRTGAKISKDGHRYKSIPFDQAKAPSQQTPFQNQMVKLVKRVLKQEGVPFKKIEYNADGSPRLGKLHHFDISSPKPSARASHDVLAGLSIFQTKTASGKVRRDIMTFRTISDKDKSKWIHPGREPSHFFEEALKFAEETWEKEVMPEIMKRFE